MRVSPRVLIAALFLGGITTANLFAQSPERLLIPFYTEAPIEGAHGSVWTTELTIHAQGTAPLILGSHDSQCHFTCPQGIPTAPGVTFHPALFETELQGVYLTLDPADRQGVLPLPLSRLEPLQTSISNL